MTRNRPSRYDYLISAMTRIAATQPARNDDATLLDEAASTMAELRSALGRVIVGQDATVQALLAAVLAEGHCLIVGVPGLAKTLLVRTLAQALGWRFKRIQFTPDMMPADVIGTEVLQEDRAGGMRTMRFAPGPIFANFILADEINRTPPKTQSALLEAMQEYTVTTMGRTHALERPFLVAATQNPIEHEGTYPLPEAQLDRFMLSLWMDYPSRAEEERIVAAAGAPEEAIEPVLSVERWRAYADLVRRVPASGHAVQYAVSLARGTRPNEAEASEWVKRYVQWGVGPRGAQHLIVLAKALAVLAGEPAVNAGHVRRAAPLVFRHRVLVNYQAMGDGVDAAAVVRKVVEGTTE